MTSSGGKQFRFKAPFVLWGELIVGMVLFAQEANLALLSGILRTEEESGHRTFPDSSKADEEGNDPNACKGTSATKHTHTGMSDCLLYQQEIL